MYGGVEYFTLKKSSKNFESRERGKKGTNAPEPKIEKACNGPQNPKKMFADCLKPKKG